MVSVMRTCDFSHRRNKNTLKVKVLEHITGLNGPFSPRELAEGLGEPLPRVQMELLRLTRQGCVKRYWKYRGVRNHPFVYEAKDNAQLKLDHLRKSQPQHQ
jgi:predicted transcriptional regulator